jgi:hypothetical protein
MIYSRSADNRRDRCMKRYIYACIFGFALFFFLLLSGIDSFACAASLPSEDAENSSLHVYMLVPNNTMLNDLSLKTFFADTAQYTAALFAMDNIEVTIMALRDLENKPCYIYNQDLNDISQAISIKNAIMNMEGVTFKIDKNYSNIGERIKTTLHEDIISYALADKNKGRKVIVLFFSNRSDSIDKDFKLITDGSDIPFYFIAADNYTNPNKPKETDLNFLANALGKTKEDLGSSSELNASDKVYYAYKASQEELNSVNAFKVASMIFQNEDRNEDRHDGISHTKWIPRMAGGPEAVTIEEDKGLEGLPASPEAGQTAGEPQMVSSVYKISANDTEVERIRLLLPWDMPVADIQITDASGNVYIPSNAPDDNSSQKPQIVSLGNVTMLEYSPLTFGNITLKATASGKDVPKMLVADRIEAVQYRPYKLQADIKEEPNGYRKYTDYEISGHLSLLDSQTAGSRPNGWEYQINILKNGQLYKSLTGVMNSGEFMEAIQFTAQGEYSIEVTAIHNEITLMPYKLNNLRVINHVPSGNNEAILKSESNQDFTLACDIPWQQGDISSANVVHSIDLKDYFTDPDPNDRLTFEVAQGSAEANIEGSQLVIPWDDSMTTHQHNVIVIAKDGDSGESEPVTLPFNLVNVKEKIGYIGLAVTKVLTDDIPAETSARLQTAAETLEKGQNVKFIVSLKADTDTKDAIDNLKSARILQDFLARIQLKVSVKRVIDSLYPVQYVNSVEPIVIKTGKTSDTDMADWEFTHNIPLYAGKYKISVEGIAGDVTLSHSNDSYYYHVINVTPEKIKDIDLELNLGSVYILKDFIDLLGQNERTAGLFSTPANVQIELGQYITLEDTDRLNIRFNSVNTVLTKNGDDDKYLITALDQSRESTTLPENNFWIKNALVNVPIEVEVNQKGTYNFSLSVTDQEKSPPVVIYATISVIPQNENMIYIIFIAACLFTIALILLVHFSKPKFGDNILNIEYKETTSGLRYGDTIGNISLRRWSKGEIELHRLMPAAGIPPLDSKLSHGINNVLLIPRRKGIRLIFQKTPGKDIVITGGKPKGKKKINLYSNDIVTISSDSAKVLLSLN